MTVADLDIVNPYFRTKDGAEILSAHGIRLISSEYANSNVDLPALPGEAYALVDDRSVHGVIDVGGDDRGALALGRWRDAILAENNYEMLLVVNCYRPLTRDVPSTLEVMAEIETAARMRVTGVVNNSNLGEETTPGTVLSSMEYARGVCEETGLPRKMTTVKADLLPALEGRIDNLFPLNLQEKIK